MGECPRPHQLCCVCLRAGRNSGLIFSYAFNKHLFKQKTYNSRRWRETIFFIDTVFLCLYVLANKNGEYIAYDTVHGQGECVVQTFSNKTIFETNNNFRIHQLWNKPNYLKSKLFLQSRF